MNRPKRLILGLFHVKKVVVFITEKVAPGHKARFQ